MVICIECNSSIASLYTWYSPANIKLTVCTKCNKFADKYIEHGNVVIFIDLLLLKPQVFRHLVFNLLAPIKVPKIRQQPDNEINNDKKNIRLLTPNPVDVLHPRVCRLSILITLFDVYLTWARVEKSFPHTQYAQHILSLPVIIQYIFFLFLCISETLIGHVAIRLMSARLRGYNKNNITGNTISTALFISSATKLFPILMVIWSYDIPLAAMVVGWVVNLNVIVTLCIILNCGYVKAIFITSITAILQILIWRNFIVWLILRNTSIDYFTVGLGSWRGILVGIWHSVSLLY
ncbi:Arv1-like protein [Nadsonia fulvescens var. elongata DSM 6958]|uniref:Protein ARV n=1 Tax=Nadsonia fulvescens var. elongata DSM 6958 TaxID=857566 RepID=A0A1E3PQC0_9ASCO|nr:Arv1-like protein [Nadsonia fulvescens var. elongata DSM 6958]